MVCAAEPERSATRELVIPFVNAPFRVELPLPAPQIVDRPGEVAAELSRGVEFSGAQELPHVTVQLGGKRHRKIDEDAVFRFTVKGWTLFEMDENRTEFFNMYRIKQKNLRKPEIMFSITKEF